jgi:hypothetical protein
VPFADELRLLLTLSLTGTVFVSAYAFARRLGAGGRLQAACDGLLLGYVIQYAAVALPGAFGVLSVPAMAAGALAACALCWAGARAHRRVNGGGGRIAPRPRLALLLRGVGRPDRLGFLAAALFTAAYIGVHAYEQRWLPVFSTDPLVYHLPAAVQWMQTGRLGLFDTWYWNPAATYSPATSSTFMFWLLAPMRNDLLARYVQVVPLLLIFLAVARLARVLGCGLTVAGCVGAAAALSRPLFSQMTAPKDDLIVTAFFACAVLSLSGGNPRDRLGPWRAGLAFGMVLASKYTILLACPLFLFFVDVPFRLLRRGRSRRDDDGERAASPEPAVDEPTSGKRRLLLYWSLALLVAATLAMPWYVRTWLVTGNPLFPVDVKLFGRTLFAGLFTTERDQQLRSAGGVWAMLSATYHSLTAVPLVVLALAYVAAAVGAGRSALRDPLKRACLIGVPVTIAIFLLASPHHEVRYVFPFLPLLFAVGGFAIVRWVPLLPWRVAAAASFAGVSVATSFAWELRAGIAVYAVEAAIISAAGVGMAFALSVIGRRRPEAAPQAVGALAGLAALALLMKLYVEWPAHLQTYREGTETLWKLDIAWPEHADAWHYVRAETPPDATIAFANTAYVYPLYGFDLTRRIVYAPVNPRIKTFLDVPRLGDTVPGDLILDAMARAQNANAEREAWLGNLRERGAQYVLIHKHERGTNPPELAFARESPRRLEPVFEDAHAVVCRVK